MLLIKEPRIEKCYTTLAERVGGIDFHAGTLFEQEGYKYNVFREGHEIMMNPEGSYFERGGKALGIVPEGLQGRQNLVDWHDVSDYYGKKDKEPLIEAGLKQLYTTDDDKGSFEIQSSLYPSLNLKPTYNSNTKLTVFEGSYLGASSFAAWDDATGNNRRMLEVRAASYESSMDNAVLLRTAVNNSWSSHRVFHAGMATPIPVANGGTGGATAKAALNSLGIFFASTLPSSGTDGQICLVPMS